MRLCFDLAVIISLASYLLASEKASKWCQSFLCFRAASVFCWLLGAGMTGPLY